MANFSTIMKSGHPKTLFAAFLYFDFCFAVWVLNGAMAPFISETFKLSPAQTGLMISVPVFAGALMRFPLGIIAQYIGRKNAALVEMGTIILAMLYGWLAVTTFSDVIAMGVLLGIAGASFGVALSLGSGWFPKEYKGLAMGIAGAGNSGTVLALLFAPPLAQAYGWRTVYGLTVFFMMVPFVVMAVMAKEPPDREHQSFKEHIKCLWEGDGWAFNLIYIITFGGFLGLANYLPTLFYDQFGVTKIEAGRLAMLATLTGSLTRVAGGYFADKIGGILTLSIVLLATVAAVLLLITAPSLTLTTLLFMLCFAVLGAGNGAVFQLVPLRWPNNTAVAGSMIGEIGALGGVILPNALGLSKQYTGSFGLGFAFFAALSLAVFVGLMFWKRRWVGVWVGPGGKALAAPSSAYMPGSPLPA